MINSFKNITSQNPIGEIWKYLRFFLDIPSVSEKIRHIHNIKKKSQFDSDVKKQARQIGFCIRQAEEYFQASSEIGISTRPTLLYYGAVNLSRALILLRQDGTHSFDALRKSEKHNHHGLDLVRGLVEGVHPEEGPETFFSSIQCKCHIKKRVLKYSNALEESGENLSNNINNNNEFYEGNIPWGHFSLFYHSLVPCAFHVHFERYENGKSTFIKGDLAQFCANLLPLESFISDRFNALNLIKTLPDIYFDLIELGIKPDLCQGNLKLKVEGYYKTDEQGKKDLEKIKDTNYFFIDNISPDQKEHLLTLYQKRNPNIKLEADLGAHIYLKFTEEYSPTENFKSRYYPDMVDDIHGRKFYILKPENYLPEPATYLVLLYCLGMLSRYYPDIWMNAIEKNIQITEVTNSLLNIIYRKFPNLILDQMTWIKHYVHI